MANFDYLDTEPITVAEPTTAEVVQETVTPSGKVQIVNKMSSAIDITLLDGSNLHVGPQVRGLNINKSRPVMKKHLPSYIKRMVSKKEIVIVNC
jgi:hypothetical protein